MDTQQGESHDVKKTHRPGARELFSIPGPAINKLGNLGQVTPSLSSCEMILDSDSYILNWTAHQNHLCSLLKHGASGPAPQGPTDRGMKFKAICGV